ncbi:MAG TPA: AMP-binding protein [Pseudonocardiaceae bacterium]|nr:AMP-binding protein [Pseudonocardiaceae bacterium]
MASAGVATVPALLAARAISDPEKVALRLGLDRLTYREWDERSARVAANLLDRGLRRGDPVGLVFDGAGWLDFAVAYCGVQRALGVAVPLGVHLGARTITESLGRCGVVGVIRGATVSAPESVGWCARVEELDGAADRPLDVVVRPADIAQILYTSGTTGRPKGVVASHANLTNGLAQTSRRRPLAHSTHCLHAFALGSNAAQAMLVQALVAAPTTVIAEEFEAESFVALIERHRVGSVFLVPAMAVDLLTRGVLERHDLTSVVLLGSTAAALPPSVALALAAALPRATLTNCYTSTEAAPAQLTMVFDPRRPTALGQPARPDQLRITDPDGLPVPLGGTGAVWLRSAAPPRGYRDDPDGNARTFADGWVAMGDLGYQDADGYLHLVDRADDLVKSGGLAVSTVRVEAALHEHPSVADAAVVGVPHPMLGQVPAAAIVPAPGVDRVSEARLRAFVAGRLARYEVPAVLRYVDELPRNAAGKVRKPDLRELLALGAGAAPTPVSATESALAGLWTDLLGGTGDDFFALGGDSLRAAQFATLAGEFFGVPVPTSLVFDRPDLAGQAAWIDAARSGAEPADDAGTTDDGAGRKADLPLSSLQEHLLTWMHETDPPRDVGPMHVTVRILEDVDAGILATALNELTRRHEALRTRFSVGPSGWTATVRDRLPAEVVLREATGATVDERRQVAAELVSAEVARPPDWRRGPLVRLALVRVGPEEHLAALVVHHLVVDGWSMGVLLRELGLLYSALRTGHPPTLPPAARGSEVVEWSRRQWPRTRAWWHGVLDGAPPAVEHFPGRHRVRAYRAAAHHFRLDDDIAAALREVARHQRSTHFVVVAACWLAILARHSGASEFLALTTVTGRPKPEFETAVGCLTQSLLLRVRVGDDPPLHRLIERVRDALLAATDHQAYPFGEFSVPYPVEIPFSRWPGGPHIPGLLSEPFALPHGLVWRWPLSNEDRGVPKLELAELPGGAIEGWLTYNDEAFTEDTVGQLVEELLVVLARVDAHRDRSLSELTATGSSR